MTDEPIPSLAEAMAEIRRLRARVLELEATIGAIRGTLSTAYDEDGLAFRIEHNVPPNAPR